MSEDSKVLSIKDNAVKTLLAAIALSLAIEAVPVEAAPEPEGASSTGSSVPATLGTPAVSPSDSAQQQSKAAQHISTSSAWVVHENNDLANSQRCGWRLEVPSHWASIPDVTPGWPISKGWRTPDGDTSLIVTWLAKVNEGEYATLRSRRYLETDETVAGISCRFFRKINGPTFEQILYIPKDGSIYRISAFGKTRDKAVLQKAIDSFGFISAQAATSSSQTYNDSNLGLSFMLPQGSGLTASPASKGLDILNQSGGKIVAIRARSVTPAPGQSFRGMARNMGRDFISGAKSLSRFEPYQVADSTGYLAVWETDQGTYVGPIIYVPFKRGSYNVLELELLDSKAIEQFFKIANTLKFGSN